MNDPITIVARAAAQRLEAEARPGLVAEVEAALAARESPSAPPQYVDPVALASLIVGIASLQGRQRGRAASLPSRGSQSGWSWGRRSAGRAHGGHRVRPG